MISKKTGKKYSDICVCRLQYRIRKTGRAAFTAALSFVVSAGALLGTPLRASADKVSELQQQTAQTQSELDAVNSEAQELTAEAEEVAVIMDEKRQEIVQIMTSINVLEDEISRLEVQIAEKQAEYDDAKAEEDRQYNAMKRRIKFMYEEGETDYVEILMKSTSFSDFLNKAEYANQMYDYDRAMLEKFQQIQIEVAEVQAELEDEKSEQEANRIGLQEEQEALQVELDDLHAQYENIDAQIEEARAEAAELSRALIEQNARLQTAIADKKKAEEEARRRAEEARRRAEEEARARAEEEARQRAEEEARRQAEDAARRKAEEEAAAQQTEEGQTQETQSQESEQTQETQQTQEPDNTQYEESVSVDGGETQSESSESSQETSESSGQDSGSSSRPSSSSVPVSASGVTGQDVVNYACQFVGNPYVYGGNSLTNGTDCSGFTNLVYHHFGYNIARTDVGQRGNGIAVGSLAEALPGDIICYPGHVGLYCGNNTIVHASTERTGIKYSDVNYRAYICIRRIIY